jgi:fructose-1,6-bisphosphatase I
MENNTRNISDYTKFIVDLRRHMWMAGIEMELRRLIWQIATQGNTSGEDP